MFCSDSSLVVQQPAGYKNANASSVWYTLGMHQYVTRFDQTIARTVSQLPLWLNTPLQIVSFFGLPAVVIALAVSLAIFSWLKGNLRLAGAQLACLVALGGNTLIKQLVHRSRPDTIYVEHMRIHSYSFPSGHAFGSTVFYGLLALLVWQHLPQPWNLIVMAALVGFIFLIGLSRVYLGAHFPSDVAVGWLLGSLSLLAIVKLFKIV
jgi:membrane-associated phospholipid phosphatase